MRFDLLARRITVLALGPALAVAVAACSSSSSTSAATSPSSSAASSPAASAPAASSSAPASSSSSGAAAQITANWEKFFNASTTPAQKAALLPLASGIGAKVTKVVVTSSTEATVTYNIVAGGASLLSGKTGTSVYQDGTWKVGDASLCELFTLIPGGSVPAACSSAG
jgi:cytoskeletal protein RodZ